MKYTSPNYIKQVLKENGFSPLKRFGQNFLIDENIVKKIADISEAKEANIIEIGPGLGALSSHLLVEAKKLVAIEIDNGFSAFLKEEFSDRNNFKIINIDILEVDLEKLCKDEFGDEPIVLAANLPYYITSACIMKFLKANINIERIVVMVQKEVAKRICAKPGTSDYGSLSAIVSFFCKPKIDIVVSGNCFLPKPDIDSAVVSMEINKSKEIEADKFIDFVRSCFAMKRKTLLNNLKKVGYDREEILKALIKIEIKENARAEELSENMFIELIKILT
jgi:16S rRNA (adenine1518-N6/adenine1519-N6)-dimethyltransferase